MVNTLGLGRPPRTVEVEYAGPVGPEELALLGGDRGVRTPALKRLTQMHHAIARLVAQGEAGYAIAMSTGYSESRISILKADPAFQELVALFARDVDAEKDKAYANHQAGLLAGFTDVSEIIHDRCLEERDTMALRDLIDAGKYFADRAGFGPATKSQNLNVTMDIADALAVGRQRAEALAAAVPGARAEKKERLLGPRGSD